MHFANLVFVFAGMVQVLEANPQGLAAPKAFVATQITKTIQNDYVSVKIYRLSGSRVLSHLLVLVRMRDRSDRERTVSDSVLVLLKDGFSSLRNHNCSAIPER